MLRSRLGLIGLCALVVGLMGFGASAAQAAPEWLILTSGGFVKTAAELPAVLEGKIEGTTFSLLTKMVKIKIEVRCTSATLSGMKLESGGKLTSGSKVRFGGCGTFNAATGTEEPECKPKTPGAAFGTLETFQLKGQLQTNGEIKVESVAGTTFATLEFEAGCVLPSPVGLAGTIFFEDCEGKAATHLKEHLLKQGAGTSLFLGADTAEHLETSLDGSVMVFLGNPHTNLLWGAIFP